MKRYTTILTIILCAGIAFGSFDSSQEFVGLMEKAGMQEMLSAPVRITIPKQGPVAICDEGMFIVQQLILDAENAAEPNIIVDREGDIKSCADRLVIVTHGWLDKGQGRWPNEMANAMYARVDPNQWMCGSFDWSGGSLVISSVYAAQYARDIGGPRLAAAIIKLSRDWRHIHLIGHSAGSWTIQTAAERLAEVYPNAIFHLTFLDAYVPSSWDPNGLGHIFDNSEKQQAQCWAEHYFTKDITFKVTQQPLKWAHNVDISAVDPLICEHEFPYRWYMATVAGSYYRWDEKEHPVYCRCEGVDYGFSRSLESGNKNWIDSLKLSPNNPALILQRPAAE